MAQICGGLNVLELGESSISGSLAGMLLADSGARVVKVEPPGGDAFRHERPSGFLVWNRGKESLVLDVRTAEGQEELRTMAAQADVVIDTYAPGVTDAWGVGYEQLSAANQRLVHCSITGFGRVGPYRHFPGDNATVMAKIGAYTQGAFGFRDGPIYTDAPMASTGAGHLAFAGIMAALTVREHTGRGQQVETSLVQGMVPFDYYGMMMLQAAQKAGAAAAPQQGPSGISSAAGASRSSFTMPTADGRWVNFTHMLPHQAQALTRALGLADTIDQPRFANQPLFATAEDAQAWEDLLWEALHTKTYAEWEPILLAEENIAFEMARRSEEGLDHAQIIHNGNVITIEDPVLGAVRQVGPVAYFSETPAQVTSSAPVLDAHGGVLVGSTPPESVVAVSTAAPAHPLAGITIVELGYFYAMPYGLTVAASLGARVIKLEDGKGDPMRTAFGVPEVTSVKTMEGKESLAVDLRSERGRAIVHQLVANADVFVDSFRPGVAQRLGLDPVTVRGINPRIVYVHASGYGTDGPFAQRPIYAGVASALAGQVVRHGGRWMDPELTMSLSPMEAQAIVLPHIRGPVDGDTNASIAVLSSLLLGIYHQRHTGQGQFVATSMIGGNAMAYADDFVSYAAKPPLPLPDEDNHGLHALYRLYRARTGWLFIAAHRQSEWEALARALGRADLIVDDRFSDDIARRANDAALTAELGAILATRHAADWEGDLVPRGIGVVQAFEGSHSEFTCTDPVLRETGLTVEVDHPLFGRILRAGPLITFSETPARSAPSCLAGEHTERILLELGYDDEQIAKLQADGIVTSLGR